MSKGIYAATSFRIASASNGSVRATPGDNSVPHSIFAGSQLIANRLTIRLQPEEEIALTLMNKTPDLEHMMLRPLSVNLRVAQPGCSRADGACPTRSVRE